MKRVGIIGYGWVAGANHKMSYAIAEDVRIAAVCDLKPERLQVAKEEYGLTDDCLFTDYKALIDSGKVDMVDICTPNNLHCPIAKYALNAGLPVSIEKPVGMNAKEVAEVQALAKEKNLPVFICLTWRHMPTTRFFKDVVDSGIIGKVYHCYIKCIKESGLWDGRRLEWRFDAEQAGSGVLGDLGSHMFDFLNWMNEEIVGLSANSAIFVKERQKVDSDEIAPVTTDDSTSIIANLKSGATANIELSRCAKGLEQLVEFVIFGEKGSITFSNEVGEGLELNITGDEKGRHRVPTPEEYGKQGSIFQSQSFLNMTDGKTDRYTSTLDGGLKAQYIIDAAMRSAKEGRYVTIEEIKNEIQ